MSTDAQSSVDVSVDDIILEKAYTLSIEAFGALTAKERDMVLFALLRVSLGNIQYLTDKVNELEHKARQLGTPEGMQALTERFMGGLGGGGMLKGLGF